MKLIYKAIPNTPENRAKLKKGDGYIVLFRDSHNLEQRTVGALWNGQDFDYAQSDFTTRAVTPSLEQKKDKHLVVAFANAKHYETED